VATLSYPLNACDVYVEKCWGRESKPLRLIGPCDRMMIR
jgi:hypothetical protein